MHNQLFYLYNVNNTDEVEFQFKVTKNLKYYYYFVFNSFHSIFSQYDENTYYVLLQDKNNCVFNFSFLFNFYSLHYQISFQWYSLWMKKCDYIKSFYSSIKGVYPIIDESIDYYLSMLELAIYYVKDYQYLNRDAYIQHKEFDIYSYFNPINVKGDFIERDISEYLKYVFFHDNYHNVDIKQILLRGKDFFNYDLIIGRLIYPNYYFDIFDDVIMLKKNQSSLLSIINNTVEYEKYLLYIVQLVREFYPVKELYFS